MCSRRRKTARRKLGIDATRVKAEILKIHFNRVKRPVSGAGYRDTIFEIRSLRKHACPLANLNTACNVVTCSEASTQNDGLGESKCLEVCDELGAKLLWYDAARFKQENSDRKMVHKEYPVKDSAAGSAWSQEWL